jgi:tetratricopeptide (TPR) repeat protein
MLAEVTPRDAIAAVFLALASASPAGCKATRAPALTDPGPAVQVANLDQFEAALNRYALLPEGSAARAEQRGELVDYLVGYLDDRLRQGDEDEAIHALRYAAALYTPGELRSDTVTAPALGRAAHGVYRAFARRGAEAPSMLALAVEQRFAGDAARKEALDSWAVLEKWVVENGPYASEPLLRHEELERALEEVAAVFPSPFVVKRLSDLYVARYKGAKASRGHDAGSAARRRMEITGYLIMRLHLRADDLAGARGAMAKVELDLPVAKLAEMMEDAFKQRRTATGLLGFSEQFAPEPDADPDEPYTMQGWAIVDNISRRAVAEYPKDPYAHLLRARSLRQGGLHRAAIRHLRQCIALKEDVFAAWQELAQLEQRDLERLAARDPIAAAKRLPEIEAFHGRATKLWSDRPIRPGMPEAFFTVAEGLYEAGDSKRAHELLVKSVGIEPVPSSLDLLGTIALKRSNLAEAQAHYEELARLAYDSELAQLQWEARARQQLGEIALRRGDAADSMRHIRIALRHTNELLARTTDDAEGRAARLVDRGKLLFYLGDTELAMADFARAEELAPDSVKVYADPLISVVSHGYYDQARTIFRRAIGRKELAAPLKLYFALWVSELARRQGHPPEPDAEAFLTGYRADAWGQALAKHARGQLDYTNLLEAADDRGEKAEAHFYEALRRWRAGDEAGAKELLRKVIASGMMGFFEYDMAQAYLAWNEVPRGERRPLSARAAR